MTFTATKLSLTVFTLLYLSTGLDLSGQNDSITVSTGNAIYGDSAGSGNHSLFLTAGFGSNMIYLGSTISQNKPFYSTGLTYGFKNTLYVSASVSHIQGIDPWVAFYSVAANYLHTFNSWFDISAEISGYKTAPSLEGTLFNPFLFTNLTAGFDWKILYTRISAGALFSKYNTGFLQLSNSRYFQTPEFFKGKAYISFDPEINVLFGEIITETTASGERRFSYRPPFGKKKREPIPPVVSYSTRFGTMNIQFSLPVTFNYGKTSLEAAPYYILPATTKSPYQVAKGFTFYLAASYRFF